MIDEETPDEVTATEGSDAPGARPGGVSRRAVVVGLGGAATAALVGALVAVRLVDDEGTASSPTTDSSAASNSIRRVGDSYRKAYPDEDDRATLEAALPRFEGLDASQVESQLATLEQQVRNDFADGHVVMVDGWVLAVTEARAAALLSLLA